MSDVLWPTGVYKMILEPVRDHPSDWYWSVYRGDDLTYNNPLYSGWVFGESTPRVAIQEACKRAQNELEMDRFSRVGPFENLAGTYSMRVRFEHD